MPVDKNFRGKPEHNPQQCIGCAACVNACPSNALTVETDLKTGELAWQFNLGRCIFCGRCEEVCPTAAFACRRSTSWRCGRKRISSSSRALPVPLPRLQASVRRAKRDRLRHRAAAAQRRRRAEHHRESFETCPECKRQKCLLPSDRIDITRHMREAS
jgi:formate hydrogenlyase subunit 6